MRKLIELLKRVNEKFLWIALAGFMPLEFFGFIFSVRGGCKVLGCIFGSFLLVDLLVIVLLVWDAYQDR